MMSRNQKTPDGFRRGSSGLATIAQSDRGKRLRELIEPRLSTLFVSA